MQEVKKHEYLNNISSMKTIFIIAEIFNYLVFLIVFLYFILAISDAKHSSIYLDISDPLTIVLFIAYMIPIIINLVIIRIFKKGFKSINSLFKHLLQSINELEDKIK